MGCNSHDDLRTVCDKITIYWCDFCGFEFATFVLFPDDILPYCPNCSNDEDIYIK